MRDWVRWVRPFLLFISLVTSAAFAGESGEQFLSTLNCVACHAPADDIKSRVAGVEAPRLGTGGPRLSHAWLSTHLTDPQSAKPGSRMPDAVHALAGDEKKRAVESLVHFLVSIQRPVETNAFSVPKEFLAIGETLFHKVGCVACHAPIAPIAKTNRPDAKAEFDALAKSSVPLGDLPGKYTLIDLALFLKDPVKFRPSGRMPSMKLGDGETLALSAYLLRSRFEGLELAEKPGLLYETFDILVSAVPTEFSKLMPSGCGVASLVGADVYKGTGAFAARFRGTLTIPEDGNYSFSLESRDGATLTLDGKILVNNDGVHDAKTANAAIKLTAGKHAFELGAFNQGAGKRLRLQWRTPEHERSKKEKSDMPASVFSHAAWALPDGHGAFAVDEKLAASGREWFTKLNCAACHGMKDMKKADAKPFAQLAGAKGIGCLADAPPATAPKYALTAPQREAIQATLGNLAELSKPLAAAEVVHRTFDALNCAACHQRDKKGGPAGLRREYFAPSFEADLGDEGVLPPHLNGVGAKLQPAWMEGVLTKGVAVRPYMATRMPQFGAANVKHLIEAFEKADTLEPGGPALAVDPLMAKFGQRLVGTTGLSCVSCHVFNGRPSLGVPALDLVTTNERLKPVWFDRYLRNPASLRPGTRMPSFWDEDGEGANKAILEGKPDLQIKALWSYLAEGAKAQPPPGVLKSKQELVPDKEPLIYRNFITGVSARAIGVGYPERANLAYDAEEMRIALLWQGPFMDAAKHRNGRGVGFEGPLGMNQQALPAGAPFAVLDSENAPWPETVGREAGYHFKGYAYDAKRQPAFKYTYNGIQVEDFPEPLRTEKGDDVYFKRTLKLSAEKPVERLYLRAAVGNIQEKDGAFIIENKIVLRFPGAKPLLRKSGDKTELLVPVPFNGNAATLTEEIKW